VALIDLIPVGVLMADADGRVTAANRAWSDLSGLTASESMGEGWAAVFDPVVVDRLRVGVRRITGGAPPAHGDFELAAGAPARWSRWWISRTGVHDAPVVMAVADITEDRAQEFDLTHRASHDALTGLFTRDQFVAFVDRALRDLDRHPGHVAVLFADLDGFKAVNDHGGHRTGDQVLAAAARRMQDAVRPGDVVARVGGDEFAVLCEDLDDERSGCTVAERIRSAFIAPINVDGGAWHVGVTVGVATSEGLPDDAEGLLEAADDAMYKAKPLRHLAIPGAGNPGDLAARDDPWADHPTVDDGSRVVLEVLDGMPSKATTLRERPLDSVYQNLLDVQQRLRTEWVAQISDGRDSALADRLTEAAHLVHGAALALNGENAVW
jgi:diguanylate cyclase (GGDEF)-like protein/PAS domain S-box-containing protein